jgi:hypothetical protein
MADENTIDYPALCEELSARVAELEVSLSEEQDKNAVLVLFMSCSVIAPFAPLVPLCVLDSCWVVVDSVEGHVSWTSHDVALAGLAGSWRVPVRSQMAGLSGFMSCSAIAPFAP